MRTQQVVIESVFSSSITVSSGVPHGMLLGPLVFIIYQNDLPDGISLQVRFVADNCILCRKVNTLIDCHEWQKDIHTLCNWESKWQMKFNIDKCYITHVTHKKNPLLMTYGMNGGPLEVTSHTYLGIGINNKLSLVKHISNAISKSSKDSYIKVYSFSTIVNETAYKILVRQKLEYCSSVLDPYRQE